MVVMLLVKTYLFTDDITILYKGMNLIIIQIIPQNTLNKLQNWSEISGFIFSESKMDIITFNRCHSNISIKLYLNDKKLKQIKSIKILIELTKHHLHSFLCVNLNLTWTKKIRHVFKFLRDNPTCLKFGKPKFPSSAIPSCNDTLCYFFFQ